MDLAKLNMHLAKPVGYLLEVAGISSIAHSTLQDSTLGYVIQLGFGAGLYLTGRSIEKGEDERQKESELKKIIEP
jgi:hypothetical protein